MKIRQSDMKLTDQIERELIKSSMATPTGNGLIKSASAFTTNGAWLTAAVLAVAAAIWMLAWQ